MAGQSPARIHIQHRDPILAAGLHAILGPCDGLQLSDSDSADLLIADYAAGVTLAASSANPALRIVVITHIDMEWQVRCALEAGVHAYLVQPCPAQALIAALQQAIDGGTYLSPCLRQFDFSPQRRNRLTGRENDVLQLLATGRANKQIARDLGIGIGTVKTHLKGVMSKLGATARTQAVVLATRRGLVGPHRSWDGRTD